MRVKWTAAIGAALLPALLLSGCAGKQAQTGDDEAKPFTVTLRHVLVRDDAKPRLTMLEDVVKMMEAAVPGLKVELEGVEDKVNRFEKLPAEMATGTPPKIFDLFGGTDTQKYVKAKRLLDLTPILDELGLRELFFNLDEFTVDGKVYGLPMAGFVEGVYYNKRIFAKLGVQVPLTWEEFIDVSEKAKKSGITPIALASADAWVINMMANTLWVRTAGAESVPGFVDGTRKWTDPDVADGFRRFDELVRRGFFPEGNLGLKYAEQQNKFKAGEAAMMFDGSWANSSLIDKQRSNISGGDIGFFNFPGVGGKGDSLINGSYSNGYGFSSNLNEREREAVVAFIRAMFSETMQKRQLVEVGVLPAMKLTNLSGVPPIVGEVLQAANTKQFPAFDSIVQAKVRETLETGMQELLGGKTTPEKLLAAVQRVQEAANKETASRGPR
ncbi:extracellular solute-binding protein [Paenibacillus ginsengarvi]|uniref:Extracellular solute-binding protein n=1 Tax=Paenibacillus ginsengarvi TaxID=400777 RepID=A0A3B0CM22_9BACL|nr:extracellular solute-binding protein [Paenibacillus ginsengarvi]RKN85921.1 extracellular solute-binding protein [Paenibacillus ginsengarvi]